MVCCSHFLKHFPQSVVIHIVKGFGIFNTPTRLRKQRLGRRPPVPISTWSRLSSRARGGPQKLAPGPPSTCPRAAEVSSRVYPVPFPPPPPPSAARSPITGGRGERLLFKRPRKLRHPHWRVPCTCLPPPRSATLSSSRVLGPASCPQAGGGSGKEVEGIEFL